MEDDLSRVRRAADLASNLYEFRNALEKEVVRKYEAEKCKPPSTLASKNHIALLHLSNCATLREGQRYSCTCGVARKHRQERADMIEALLDCGGTCSHRNALELRDHWYEAEQELVEALETIKKLSERFNNPHVV